MTDPDPVIPFDPAITRDTALRGLPLVVIDTETTGLPPCDVVELAIIRATFGGEFVEDGDNVILGRVKPLRKIDPKAREVHGISNAAVSMCNPWATTCGPSLVRWCEGAVPMAYNAPFDHHAVTESGRGAFPVPAFPWLDPLVWARAVWGPVGNRLAEVAARLGIEAGTAHSAYDDALTCFRVARPVLLAAVKAGKAPPVRTLGELLDWQVAEAVRQEAAAPSHHDKPWTKWSKR